MSKEQESVGEVAGAVVPVAAEVAPEAVASTGPVVSEGFGQVAAGVQRRIAEAKALRTAGDVPGAQKKLAVARSLARSVEPASAREKLLRQIDEAGRG